MYIYIYIYIYIHTYIHTYKLLSLSISLSLSMYTYIYIYIYIYVHIYTHVCTYIYIYIYIYIHTANLWQRCVKRSQKPLFRSQTAKFVCFVFVAYVLYAVISVRWNSASRYDFAGLRPISLLRFWHFRGSDTGRILISRGGSLMSMGNSSETLSRRISVGIIMAVMFTVVHDRHLYTTTNKCLQCLIKMMHTVC